MSLPLSLLRKRMLTGLIGMALCVSALLVGHAAADPAWSDSVQTTTSRVSAQGKTFSVNVVTIDLNDPMLELAPALADGGIGHVEQFSGIVEREQAVAAVNGTFFNAYEADPYSRYPNGTLLYSGAAVHTGENQTLLLDANKQASIRYVNLDLRVIVGTGSRAYTIQPWGTNKVYGDTDVGQIVWYTPDFGGWVGFPGGTKVVIRDGVIERITQESVPVPADGYVLYVGGSADNLAYMIPRLHVGDRVTTELTAKGADGAGLDARTWLAALGAGPKLVTDGAIDVDPTRDGFTDPKITTQSAARSFVGVDSSGRLVMGTVPSATIGQLADIAQQLGLREAMNLDGGASSGLFANGRMLTTPGRELSNALVVRKLDKPRVQVEINGRLESEFHGTIVKDTTVVPIRPFITALNADFQWDNLTRTATISSNGTTLKLQDGATAALVNGKSIALDVPLQIMADSRMYVPLRFVVETLKGKVDWNQRLYRASVQF